MNAPPDHPIWSLLRYAITMTALVVLLWLNASHFDSTELKTILAMLLVSGGAEAIPRMMRR